MAYSKAVKWSDAELEAARVSDLENDCRFAERQVDEQRGEIERLKSELCAARAACKRALPWIGKMIANGAHLESVAPNDCIGAMDQLQAQVDKIR